MKKKDVDLQRTLEAKLDYENKIEHIQKQLKDQTVTLKSLKSELDSEKNKQKEFQHENELMKSKLSMLEEQNKKIMRINDEFSEKEQFYKAKIETINEENRELSKKFESFKEEKLIIENECQNKLARLEEVFKYFL